MDKLNSKAQSGMEYLITYSWMIALVATIFAVIALIGSGPAQEVKFNSSDPGMVFVQGGKFTEGAEVSENLVELKLLSVAGDEIDITSFTGEFGGSCTLNDVSSTILNDVSSPITGKIVQEDGKMDVVCTSVTLEGLATKPIIIKYNDFGGLAKEVTITAGNVPSA